MRTAKEKDPQKQKAIDAVNKIKRKYDFLRESEDKKYDLFKDYDPFAGRISESLLNGNDVAKYALVTGMLEPFYIEQLSGVTYSAGFSGNMYYYDEGKNDVRKKAPDEDGYYEIGPNSITYLEIDTLFRVPNYMVLRFNLRVKNVYKGLLLGTGPIIDSGFVGRIFIPLHNLTTNTYLIQKDAKLIEIEFTKISKPQNCKTNIESALQERNYNLSEIENIDFSGIPSLDNKGILPNRQFENYITEALTNNKEFCTKYDNVFVCNSINTALNEIDKSKKKVDEIRKDVEGKLDKTKKEQDQFKEQIAQEQKRISDSIEKSERNERIMRSFSVITVISMLLTAITLFISAANYFHQSSELKLQYSTVQESIDNTDSQVDIIAQAFETIAQNASFDDPNARNEFNDIVKQLKSDNTSTTRYDSNNYLPLYFAFSVAALFLSIAMFILFIIYFIKSGKYSSKIKKLEDAINQQPVDHSEDNSNEKSN